MDETHGRADMPAGEPMDCPSREGGREMKQPIRQGLLPLARLLLLVAGPAALICLAPESPRHGAGSSTLSWATFYGLGLALTAIWAWWLSASRRADDRFARRHPLLWWGALALGSATISASLVGENIHARWGAIDDHYYVGTMGPQGNLSIGQAAHLLVESAEVGRPTRASQRYRPSFWITRHIEMVLWGAVPERFWAFRIVMFGLSVLLGWWALWVWLGGPAGGAVLAWILGFTFWCDVWCRLGCSEGHNTLGAMMMAFGAAALTMEARRRRPMRLWVRALGWTAVFAGVALAVGAKENLLVLTPVMWLLIATVGWRRLGVGAWAGAAVVTAYSALIAGVVIVATRSAKADFYANPSSMGHRLAATGRWILSEQGRGWAFLAALSVAAALTAWAAVRWGATPADGRRFARFARPRVALLAALVVVLLSQVFFYVGAFPTNTRYDFPGLIAAVLAVVAAADILAGAARICLPVPAWSRAAAALAVIAVAVVALDRGYDVIRRESRLNVETTRIFTAGIEGIARQAIARPDRPLVFVAYQPEEQETVSSVAIFLRAQGVKSAMYLVNRFNPQSMTDPLMRKQATEMAAMSALGDANFRPWFEYRPGRSPYGLFFSGPPAWMYPEPMEVIMTMSGRAPIAGGTAGMSAKPGQTGVAR